MPRMFPATGPIASSAHAERRLYDALAAVAPADALVIQRGRWVGRSIPGEPLRDGEAGFVLLDPERGILLFDVLDDSLTWDPHRHAWRRGDGPGVTIADPFARLEAAAAGLRRTLEEATAPTLAAPVIGFALVLPRGHAGPRGLGPHGPAERIIDRDGISQLAARIDALFRHFAVRAPARGNAAPRWWWRAAEDLFVAPRSVRVRLSERIAADEEAMIALGDDQVEVLAMVGRIRRLAVQGAAGTGKTVLAIERARMLARQGMAVLLTCYNKALAAHLRLATRDVAGITTSHFHELCWDLGGADARGLRPPADAGARQRFFDHTLPSLLAKALPDVGGRFDAVVVDEGQDFAAAWWPILDGLCRDGERAIRTIFFDDAQRLRDHPLAVPGADEAVTLRVNWRNTQAIHRHLRDVLPGLEQVRCVAPAGVPVAYERAAPSLAVAVQRILQRLVVDAGVSPDDIVILTGRTPTRSALLGLPQPVGPARLTAGEERGCVRVRSIQAFKGLEAPVVILAELDAHAVDRQHALYYAGASRARHHLIVLDSALLPEQRAQQRRAG